MNHTRTRTSGTDKSFRKRNSGYAASGGNRGRNKAKAVSSIDPNRLIKKGQSVEEVKYISSRTFLEMPLDRRLQANIVNKGFKSPTKIQDDTLEHLINGRDLLGVANTGTGKTGAFLLPIIQRLLTSQESFTSLVIVPTRELALQVEEEFKSLTIGLRLNSASFIGGTNVPKDLTKLRRENHLIIGTPGRLLDLANRGALRLQRISVLVLDEFDRMLDMGFVNDIKKIVRAMTTRKQTMLFSATIDKTQKPMIDELLRDPIEVKVSTGTSTAAQIDQDIIRVPEGSDKFIMLRNLIDDKEFEKVLIFAETKHVVNKISQKLNKSGIRVDHIHGNKSQNYRNNALSKFKNGEVQVLVATDVAARGIDVSDVTHVINYQLPMTYDSYVHRIGRTGRAGKTGKAFTFID
ncbi:MAG: DEAD/DEAH box helicase [Cyclobacteriaceae bacterium]|nr:DEAD/DEAH box helicase [Cyclobacteriaceae bacterium]